MYAYEFRQWCKSFMLATRMKIVNAVLHGCTSITLYFTLKKMFEKGVRGYWLPVYASLLFAAHPIHVEVIFSVVGRADILCTFFYLLAVLQYLYILEAEAEDDEHGVEYDEKEKKNGAGQKKKKKHPRNLAPGAAAANKNSGAIHAVKYISLFTCAVGALLSKELGITVLPFCAVYDVLNNTKPPECVRNQRYVARNWYNWRLWVERNPKLQTRFLILIVMTIALMLIRGFSGLFSLPNFSPRENPLAAHPDLFVRFMSSLYVAALNGWLLIFPSWLCCDWSYGSLDLIESWTDYRLIPTFLAFYVCGGLYQSGVKEVQIAVAWAIISYLPSSHIITVGFVLADRILYIPSIGYCICIAIAYSRGHELYPKAIRMAIFVLLLIFAGRTIERSWDWQDSKTLFTSALRICPNNSKIYFNLAQISHLSQDFPAALEFSMVAHQKDPANIFAMMAMGNAYRALGDYDQAITTLRRTIELDPAYARAWMNLAIAYGLTQDFEKAEAAYHKAASLHPNNEVIMYNLGTLYLRMGRFAEGEAYFRKSIECNPTSDLAHYNLIMFYFDYGPREMVEKTIDALDFYKSMNILRLTTVAQLLVQHGFGFARSEKLFLRVLEIRPNDLNAHFHLAVQYKTRGMPKKKMKYLEKLYKLLPNKKPKFKEFVKKIEPGMRITNATIKTAEQLEELTMKK
ncbi:protein O-mannosyl-transferase TMTC4-like isoform X1 [Contarinia nasturtii]|uniref:protein O-mannosyl-transferase TMTC4-like isoform X1 n=1 Tax=Contarinia nasturtii TaxID=265458 RepID=UPI0012D41184|nr:protein O-mannosyl-transferase TMTC4-like isoform X1 [Contarinia nasturtii]